MVMCADCHFKMNPLSSQETPTCPICRAKCAHVIWEPALDFARVVPDLEKLVLNCDSEFEELLFLQCKVAIKTQTDVARLCCAFLKSRTAIQSETPTRPVLLSLTQTETLLRLAEEKFGNVYEVFTIRNLLVAMCQRPWSVDKSLGRSGVCYMGNLGAEPVGLQEYLNILKNNLTLLSQRRNSFWSS
jgi:hypothetical protein